MVMAESTALEDLSTGKKEIFGYFRAKVLEDHLSGSTNEILKKAIDDKQTIISELS